MSRADDVAATRLEDQVQGDRRDGRVGQPAYVATNAHTAYHRDPPKGTAVYLASGGSTSSRRFQDGEHLLSDAEADLPVAGFGNDGEGRGGQPFGEPLAVDGGRHGV